MEIPVPRYFKEKDDNIEVKVAIKEAVDRGGGAKKKKKGGVVKKKGKAKKKKVEEEVEEKMTLKKQLAIVKTGYKDTLNLD